MEIPDEMLEEVCRVEAWNDCVSFADSLIAIH